jgi:hypothetical protein
MPGLGGAGDNGSGRTLSQDPGLKEDLVMSEREPAPGSPGGEPSHDSDVVDETREVALMRDVMRKQERHREGGVEPWLGDEVDEDPGPGA